MNKPDTIDTLEEVVRILETPISEGLYLCRGCRKYLSRIAASSMGWRCCGELVEPLLHEKEEYDS